MRREFLPFARPSITDAEVDAVTGSLRSGWLAAGPRVEAFEEAFARSVGAAGAVSLTSGTAGFHLLLRALGIGAGDEVITVSFTWPSAVNMIHLSGARPVFADIDRGTLQIDPGGVEALVTQRTRALLPVHFGGQPADLERLREICARNDLILIEDAAHAVGTEHRGRPVGGDGNPAVFSFHAIKNLTTGEGGMITAGDEELLRRLRLLRFHGVDRDAWQRHGRVAAGGYDLAEPGWKYNMTDLQAALGLAQLERLESMLRRREELARLYDELLDGISEITRPSRVPYPGRHAWHLYPVLVDRDRTGLDRDRFREELGRRKIGTGLHFLAVHRLAFFSERYPLPPGSLANTEFVADRIVSLPLFPDMSEEDVRDVVNAIRDVFSRP